MSNDRLSELRSGVEFIDAELRNIHEAAGDQPLDEATEARWSEGVAERDRLEAEAAKLEERMAIAARISAKPAGVETGDGTRDAGFNVDRTVNRDVFDLTELRAMPDKARANELRSRALTAIESAPHMDDSARETASRHAEDRSDPAKARYILEHGSPEYHEAFEAVMRNPHNAQLSRFSERAALSLTGANGGYLVPFTLDPTIILTNNGATNPMREIASIKTTATDDWNGVTSAGVTAEWVAENTEVADASPTFTQPTITPAKADAYIEASLEVVADSAISGELAMLIADAKDRLEATAFVTGSGSGQPYGVMTRLSSGTGSTASRVAGSSGAAGAADLVINDIYAVQNALPPRYRQNSSWLSEQTTYNKVRALGTTYGSAFWAELGVAIPAQLLGRPTYEASAMDNTIVSGSNDDVIVLGDFAKGYYVVDRMGLEMVYNPVVLGANRRPSGAVGWAAFWRTGGDVVDTNAFRYLRV